MFFAGSVRELHSLIRVDPALLLEEVVCICENYSHRISASAKPAMLGIKVRANGLIAMSREGQMLPAADAETLLRDLLRITLDEHAC